jgi:hypothetical protein
LRSPPICWDFVALALSNIFSVGLLHVLSVPTCTGRATSSSSLDCFCRIIVCNFCT